MGQKKAAFSAPILARTSCFLLRCASNLPISWLRLLGRTLGFLMARTPNQQRAIADLNLQLCFPEMGKEQRQRLVDRNLVETGQTLMELGALWHWSPDRIAKLEGQVTGETRLCEALSSGRGVLLLTPHLGNWEMLNAYLMRHAQLHCLYRQPRILELQGFLCEARGRTGCISIPASRAGMRSALRALRDGEVLLVLPDQEPLKSHGVWAPFFGRPALTMTLIAQLLRRTSAIPLFVHSLRRKDGRFDLEFLEAPEDLDHEDPVRAATALNHGLELCIQACPEQYLWSYKRFKTSPPGETTPYRAIWTRKQKRRAARKARQKASETV